MSYILDALRKAEAERRIGASGATQASMVLGVPLEHASRRPSRSWWLAVPAVAVAAAAGVWFGAYQAKAPVVAKIAATAAAAPPLQAAAPIPDKAPATAEKSAPAMPAAAQEAASPTPPPRESIKPRAAGKKPHVAGVERKPAPQPAAVQEQPVPSLRELPEHIQREIPPLAIGGYLYSGNKADRTVLINTRLLREGDEVAPGLRLERLMPNGMVLNFKGYRYRTSY